MSEPKDLFVIHPVRNVSPEFQENVELIVEYLEARGVSVYLPSRDTDQKDDTGLRICADNLRAIVESKAVLFIWDGNSQGCLFDLGMAFALGKPLIVIRSMLPIVTLGKSFQNMAVAWADLRGGVVSSLDDLSDPSNV